jgi:hypothetical protein
MNKFMILAGATALAISGAAYAQEASQPSTAEMPPAAGAAPTPVPMPESNVGATEQVAPEAAAPAASAAMAAPGEMSTGAAPRHYPVCTRTLQDECRNRGGV